MKALIEPTSTNVSYIASWDTVYENDGVTIKEYIPVLETLPNAARIAQIASSEFEVASPLFWVDCADDCDSFTHYYNTATNTIELKNHTPRPGE